MKVFVIITILCMALTSAIGAGTVVITAVVTGGNLTLTMPDNFALAGLTLGGASSITSDSNLQNYTIEDARGGGQGWNLGFQIEQFKTSGTPLRTIPTDKFKMQIYNVNITRFWGDNIDAAYGPKSLVDSEAAISGSETKCITCAEDYGMGKYGITADHKLIIDANLYSGTYTSTLTATLNGTP